MLRIIFMCIHNQKVPQKPRKNTVHTSKYTSDNLIISIGNSGVTASSYFLTHDKIYILLSTQTPLLHGMIAISL